MEGIAFFDDYYEELYENLVRMSEEGDWEGITSEVLLLCEELLTDYAQVLKMLLKESSLSS